jgi:hypothetical protein
MAPMRAAVATAASAVRLIHDDIGRVPFLIFS